jgi:hypothetical protein
MKFKRLFQKVFFIPHWKDSMFVCYSFKLNYLNQKGFLFHIEKT